MATVKALKYHTHAGEEHQEGDVYEVSDEQVDNLEALSMVARADADVAPEAVAEPKKYRRGER